MVYTTRQVYLHYAAATIVLISRMVSYIQELTFLANLNCMKIFKLNTVLLLRSNLILILLTATLFSVSCKHDSGVEDPFTPSAAKQLKNVAYGTDALQTADVYLPANRNSSTRTMVLIHGGFWTTGDKTDVDTLLSAIQAADPTLSIVNINYRLANGNTANFHPAQVNDVSLLLDYIQAHSAEWHIGNNIALTGISSGGQIALLYAYAYDAKKQVKVVASVLGPTNFADPYYTGNATFQQIALNLFGKTWQQDSALYKSASPLYRLTSTAPPTFLAYGGSDVLVPFSNSDSLHEKLEQLNVEHEFWLYPSETHDLTKPTILDIIKNMAVFFSKFL